MPDSLVQPLSRGTSGPPPATGPTRWPSTSRRRWVVVGFGLIAVSTILLVWAGTRPGYDPYGWLVWGDQTLHFSLNLGGAPSWKPLPYVFTVPYALAGRYELWLWMITAVTVSLAGPVFAGRIAYRVLSPAARDVPASDPISRHAPLAGAIVAGGAVLGLADYLHYVLSVQSDPMIVTFCLAAVDAGLRGRHRTAFILAVLASLGRPEVWPFLGLYAIWAWFRVPSMRWMLYGGIAVIAFMWFGIPWITNGRPNIAGQLALHSPRELRQGKLTGTISRFTGLHYLPIWVAALVSVTIGLLRRHRVVLGLAGVVALWVIVEIAFAFHGFPALPRYMFEAGAGAGVLAGVGVGWLLTELPKLRPGLPRWSGIPVAAVLVVSLVPGAIVRARTEHRDLRHERGRAHEIALLQSTINARGGYRHIRACGEPVTEVEYASVMAWMTHLDVGFVGYQPAQELRRKHRAVVLFTPVPSGGWSVRAVHTRRRERARCSNLRGASTLADQAEHVTQS